MTFAELTKEDIRVIEAIVLKSENRLQAQLREYIDLRFAAHEAKIHEKFAKVDEKFAKVNGRFAKVDEQFAKVDEQFAKVDDRFTELDKRLQLLVGFVFALVAMITVAIGIPQFIMIFRDRKYGDLQKEMDRLRQEMETFKRSQVAKS